MSTPSWADVFNQTKVLLAGKVTEFINPSVLLAQLPTSPLIHAPAEVPRVISDRTVGIQPSTPISASAIMRPVSEIAPPVAAASSPADEVDADGVSKAAWEAIQNAAPVINETDIPVFLQGDHNIRTTLKPNGHANLYDGRIIVTGREFEELMSSGKYDYNFWTADGLCNWMKFSSVGLDLLVTPVNATLAHVEWMRSQGLGPIQVVFASPVNDQVYTLSLNIRFTNVKKMKEIETVWNEGMRLIGPSLDNAIRAYSNYAADLGAGTSGDPAVAATIQRNLQSRLGNPTISGARSAHVKIDDGSGKLHPVFDVMLFSFSVKLPFSPSR